MTNPQRFITRMLVFLVVTLVVVGALYEIVLRAFMHNPALNGLILSVLGIGILYSIRRVTMLKPEVRWIESFRTNQPGFSLQQAPRLLGPVAAALGEKERRGRGRLNAVSMRYLLDSIVSRLDESRDISRYLTGLLIFLGLLGTFWGLLETIDSVGAVIGGLSVGDGDLVVVFDRLKDGLAAPLSGMGTAFSSSLFGLAGSLIVGFLDLQANQAQNAFYNDLEEWLSSLTHLSGSAGISEFDSAGPPVPAYVQALLEQTAENLDKLQRLIARGEESRITADASVVTLTERLTTLNDQMSAEQGLLARLVSSQEDLRPVLKRIGESGAGTDDPGLGHLRNIDTSIARLLDEAVAGRAQMVDELRSEIKMVSRTIAVAAGDTRGQQQAD